MTDTANWTSQAANDADRAVAADTAHRFDTPASDWWILPGAVLGSCAWVGIFYVLFQ